MEPGHEDREYRPNSTENGSAGTTPQWSPVMKIGNTQATRRFLGQSAMPQWSPVMKTGDTSSSSSSRRSASSPQWSPVMKTGNTALVLLNIRRNELASMEPGHEDREYELEQIVIGIIMKGLNGARS